jgi:hypothetical protein
MIIKNLIATAALAAISLSSSFAATAVTAPESVLIGFRATADSVATNNASGANTFLFVGLDGLKNQSFNFKSQLDTQFGTNWYSNGYVYWGIYGLNTSLGVEVDGNPTGLDANGNRTYGVTTVGTTPGSGVGLADGYWDVLTAAGSTMDSIRLNLDAAGLNQTAAGYSYGALSSEGDVAAALQLAPNFKDLLANSRIFDTVHDLSVVKSLDLSYFLPADTFASYESFSIPGVVSVSSLGEVTVVPEPSTYALLGLGAFMALIVMRRTKRA